MTLLTPKITASTDSSLIARGEYLVYGPAHCAFCHAPISEFPRLNAGEKVSMSGGFDFVLPLGVVHAPNITTDVETGIGAFTDKELARAMCHGVKRNGQAKFEVIDERGQIVKGKHFVTPNLTPDPGNRTDGALERGSVYHQVSCRNSNTRYTHTLGALQQNDRS